VDDGGFRRYAMGDLVRVRGDGALVVIGRKDRQLKIDGYRIEPVEVEAALRDEPGVLDAVVVPLGQGPAARLIAFVAVGDSPAEGVASTLRKALAARLPAAMRPQRIHVLEHLPLLAANKIDTEALRRIDAGRRVR
jgi:acyl-coenzyme A synthetase/AMP-(fatty) acid ligase